MRVLALPEALRRFGLTVELVPGWETRGSASFNPGGTVGHHTAGSSRGTRPSLAICVNGRPDLAGPLCNTFTDRNGVAVVVASGRANHAGPGGFRGLAGNSAVLGHEAEDEGDGNWTDAQLWAFPRVHAAHLWAIGRDASWYASHRTWATPRGRKTDPAGLSDDAMRTKIKALLDAGSLTTEEIADMTPDQAAQLTNVERLLTAKTPMSLDPTGSATPLELWRWAQGDAFAALGGVRALLAEMAGLRAALFALSVNPNLTAEQITAASKDGATKALEERITGARVELTAGPQ